MPDVIVTGLPRSGATLAAAIIDHLPNAVALNSPRQVDFAHKPVNLLPYCKWLVGDFAWTRTQLLNREPLQDLRAEDGTPFFDGRIDPKRIVNNDNQPIPVWFTRPALSGDFILAMKHHRLFTSILPQLVQFGHFKILAVIRDPLDVVQSWLRHDEPAMLREGVNGPRHFWPEATTIADADNDPLDKLVQLYDVYIERYHMLRDHIHIVQYEDLVRQPELIAEWLGIKEFSADRLWLKPKAGIFASENAQILREKIAKYGVFTKYYYPHS